VEALGNCPVCSPLNPVLVFSVASLNKYVGPTYSRTIIYAARMSRSSSSCRAISAAGPRPTSAANPPAAAAAMGKTDGWTDTRPFYDAYRLLC